VIDPAGYCENLPGYCPNSAERLNVRPTTAACNTVIAFSARMVAAGLALAVRTPYRAGGGEYCQCGAGRIGGLGGAASMIGVAGTPPSADLRAAWLEPAPDDLAWDRTPEQGVVSHRSAAALYGLSRLPAGRNDFTLPRRRQSRQADIRLHERRIRQDEWAIVGGLPVARPSRIASDLLDDREDPEGVANVVADAIRAGHDDPGTVVEALAPYVARLRLRPGDGMALFHWLLERTSPPDLSRRANEAPHAAYSAAADLAPARARGHPAA
jgi:hypothetical protein